MRKFFLVLSVFLLIFTSNIIYSKPLRPFVRILRAKRVIFKGSTVIVNGQSFVLSEKGKVIFRKEEKFEQFKEKVVPLIELQRKEVIQGDIKPGVMGNIVEEVVITEVPE